MERATTLKAARGIFGSDLIGPDELSQISAELGVTISSVDADNAKNLPFRTADLEVWAKTHLLIYAVDKLMDGRSITINNLREHFGTEPMSHEPCFYNQDWYLQEPFARDRVLPSGWFLLRKTLADESRGALPAIHQRGDDNAATLPYAIACAYAFFAYFLCTEGKLLWPHDYLWCVDLDHNNDQIYVGRYNDPSGINKNGFSIHRHLVIRSCYGVADYITMQGRK